MSRTKVSIPLGTPSAAAVCADCGDSDPAWASLNRGVFLCTECCSIHRSLGRHVSQVRSLRKSVWPPNQLTLIQMLYNHGSNNVWEHLLLDPLSMSKIRKKPSPRDPLYPTKADFIRAKYANLSFALKSARDDVVVSSLDLNKQLYSCVRTNHVETTLRLLALGADPNGYVDPNSGVSPLHVAAKEGQDLQTEILCLYGADPSLPDFNGLTPVEHAETAGHKELALRLIELQYEMTDRLTYYLCGRKPDHSSGQHFLIPEVSVGQIESSKIARRRLQALPDNAFEKLIQDVYDEVDRREVDAAWLACLSEDALMINDRYVVPFLPVNPDLPSTRNQYRQKLAKFTGREFSAMIMDILAESKRRLSKIQSFPEQDTTTLPKSSSNTSSAQEPHKSIGSGTSSSGDPCGSTGELKKTADSDGPLYDSVASEDEELMSTMKNGDATGEVAAPREPRSKSKSQTPLVSLEDYLDLKTQLAAAEAMVEEMQRQNDELQVEKRPQLSVSAEQLVGGVDDAGKSNKQKNVDSMSGGGHEQLTKDQNLKFGNNNVADDSSVLMDTFRYAAGVNSLKSSAVRSASLNVISQSDNKSTDNKQTDQSDRSPVVEKTAKTVVPAAAPPPASAKRYSAEPSATGALSVEDDYEILSKDDGSPSYPDNLIQLTENLTTVIQRLLADAQTGQYTKFREHASKVQSVVDSMVNAVPFEFRRDKIESTLDTMVDACIRLTVHCSTSTANHHQHREDNNFEQLSCQVVQAAYEVAKAAKALMVYIQR